MTPWEKERWLNKYGWITNGKESSNCKITYPIMTWVPTGFNVDSGNSIAVMGDDDETVGCLFDAVKNKLFYRCNNLIKNRA